MSWNNEKKKKTKDSFWLGFFPSLLLPPITLLIIFKLKYTISTAPFFSAFWQFYFVNKRSVSEIIGCLFPCLLLFFLFYILQKEKAMRGAFVGLTPSLIAAFLLM